MTQQTSDPAPKAGGPSPRLRAFISYSRRDMDVADQLVRDLEASGLDVTIDRRDLPFGEEWQKVLAQFIAEADCVVWLVSPHSIDSHWCRWELGELERDGKRLVPIRIEAVSDGDLPSALGRVHVLPATGLYDRELHLPSLVSALLSDRAWLQEHTRLGNLARRWHEGGRPAHDLLRGAAIHAAENWLKYQPSSAPTVTDIAHAFISASRREEIRALAQRRRTRNALTVLSLAAAAIFTLAYLGYLDATFIEGRTNYVRNRIKDAKLEVGQVTRDCPSSACPEMVLLPAGEFLMGSPPDEVDRVRDEGPQRKVTIARPFLVAKFEATYEEWDECYKAGACKKNPGAEWGRGRRPVTFVAWNDIQQYLSWLSSKTGTGYRLLTEAEWEYAARGSVSAEARYSTYPWGSELGQGLANCSVCEQTPTKQTSIVGSYPPNAFGLHDMVGNVFEWVHDCYIDDYARLPTDGSSPSDAPQCMRVARGGAFTTGAKFVRPAYRNRQLPGQGYRHFGFRVARDLLR